MTTSPSPPLTSTPSLPASSPGSPDSDPTTPPPSTSTQVLHPTNNGKPSPLQGGARIQYRHRVILWGPTECGKSTVGIRLLLSVAAPRLIVDPADSDLTAHIPGAIEGTFRDPRRLPHEHATMRFVPTDPYDMDAYHALFELVFASLFPCYVYVDEAGIVFPSQGNPNKAGRTMIVQGRKREIGMMGCHTRAVELDRNWGAQSAHKLVWPMNDRDDVKVIATYMGVSVEQLLELFGQCPERGFLWHDRPARTITVCPPMPPLPWAERS